MQEHTDPDQSYDEEESMDLAAIDIEDVEQYVSGNRNTSVQQQLAGLGGSSTTTVTTTCESNRNVELASVLYIVDTNFVISHLRILNDLVAQYPKFGNLLVFPVTVIDELDGLKTNGPPSKVGLQSRHQSDIALLARRANDWLFRLLARSEPAIRGQQMNEKVQTNLFGDKSIVDCCRFFQEMWHKPVVLLSNDKNLCVQALIYSIRTVSFVPGLTAREILIRSLNLPRDAIPPSVAPTLPILQQTEQRPSQRTMEIFDATMEDVDTSMDIDEPRPDLNSSKHKSRRAVTDHRRKFWFPQPDLKP
ncbi:PIN domain-containing protein [Lipomyces chichibuensis]|uniref:PIN domain-containing protein n=1 Tax=Lipomyces chichibuensis TaxID=1546026 RepID=UPI003343C9FE